MNVQEIINAYTVREIRAKLSRHNRYTVRNISKAVWALRLWNEDNPSATMQQQINQMRNVK